MSQNKPRDFKIAPKHRGAVGGSSLAQKIKGRASKVYFSPQKVSLMKWRSFGVKVKRPHKTALQPSNFSSFIYPVWADQRWTFWGHFFGIVPNLLSILLARFIHVRDHVVSHLLRASTALWVKPCLKVEIEEFTKKIPSGPIFMNLNYFRHNIWRFSSIQFHFWYILGD